MAIGYMYDETFRLLGSIPLAPNPLQAGEYLTPARCTQVVPPTGYDASQVPIFNQDAQQWSLGKSHYQLGLEASYVEAVTGYGTALYEQNIEGNWSQRDPAEVAAEDAAKEAQQNYDLEIQNLKINMDTNIINKSAEITKGTSVESIQAFIQAYQLRANNASEYITQSQIRRLLHYHAGQGGHQLRQARHHRQEENTHPNMA